MYVRVYRYRIPQKNRTAYLDLQQRAKTVYERHIGAPSLHLQSTQDPDCWMEWGAYPDRETYLAAMEKVNAEPEIGRLWEEFQSLLDPADPSIREEEYTVGLHSGWPDGAETGG